MNYFSIRENLMKSSRTVGNVEISNDLLLEVMLRASQLGLLDSLAGHYGVDPRLGTIQLQNRINKGIPLDSNGKDFESLLTLLFQDSTLRKSLSEDGYTLDDLSGEDFAGLTDAARRHKAQSAAALQKSTSQIAAESGARSRVLSKALELRMAGEIESIEVTKLENRLNRGLPIQPEIRELLRGCEDDMWLLEKNSRQYAEPLMKTQSDVPKMTPRQRAEYFLGDEFSGGKPSKNTLMKGENTLIRVERKDGSSRDIPLRKIREQLRSLAVTKSREVYLPITETNHLCNLIAKGNEAAKKRLETEYGYFLEKLFT